MSLFRRRAVEARAILDVPWDVGGTSSSSVSVNRAMGLVPVYAAIGLLARTVSCTPIHCYRRVSEHERIRIKLPALLDSLVVEGRLKRWLHTAVASLASRGNLFGLVTSRDGFNYPTAITWLDPVQVSVSDQMLAGPGSMTMPIWRFNGREVHVGPAIPSMSDLIHVPWFPMPDRTEGLSPLGACASMISTGLSAQTYASEWFDNGGIPPGTMKNTARVLLPEESDAIKTRLVSTIRSRKPLVYGADWEYSPIAIPPNEARFVETAKLTATQVAAIYDVPPERIGGDVGGPLSYTSPEQTGLHLVTFSLRNWFELLEELLTAMCPVQQYVKFNADSMLRADIKTRHEVYKIGRTIGLYSINELRAREDESPLPPGQGGDDYTPLTVTPGGNSPPDQQTEDTPALKPVTPPAPAPNSNGNGKRKEPV